MTELHHVLLVEDEEDIQRIAKMTLEMLGGYQVSICNNGQELIDNIDQISPDLILLDVMMPILDGPSAFKALMKDEKYKKLPFLFMTAKSQHHETEELLNLGVLGVISKPFSPASLVEDIKKYWSDFHG